MRRIVIGLAVVVVLGAALFTAPMLWSQPPAAERGVPATVQRPWWQMDGSDVPSGPRGSRPEGDFGGPGGFFGGPGGGPGGFGGPGGGPGGPGGRDRQFVAEFDRDGDGRLNVEERNEARQSINAGGGGRGPGGRGFGGPGGPGNREPAKPGPKVSPADVATHPDATLYDPKVLRTLFLQFENEDWEEELAAFKNSDVEVPATLTVDGKTYPNVGIHFRGMSSYMMVPAGSKRSLNLSLDYVDPDQRLYGYRTLNLLNCAGDSTLLSSVLYSHIARQYMAAPKANFVKVVINGESWGLYSNVQQFNKEFLAENYQSDSGARWKVIGNPGADGGLRYLGENIEDYRRRFEIKTKDKEESWRDLINLCRVLNETPADQLEEAITPILDIDSTLCFLALDVVTSNSDGYWTRASDYYIFHENGGKFHIAPHDMNEAFHGMGGPGGGPGGPGGPGGGPGGFPGGFGPPGGPEMMGGFPGDFGPPGGGGFPGDFMPPGGGFPGDFVPPGAGGFPGDFGPPPGDRVAAEAPSAAPGAPLDGQPAEQAGGEPRPRQTADTAAGGARQGATVERGQREFGRGFGRGPGRGGPGGGGPGFGHGGVELDPLVALDDAGKPLRSKLLQVPSFRRKYLEYVRAIAEKSLDWKNLGPVVAGYRSLIEKEVEADTKKLSSLEAFQQATADEPSENGRAGGLRSFAEKRREFLLKHAEIVALPQETALVLPELKAATESQKAAESKPAADAAKTSEQGGLFQVKEASLLRPASERKATSELKSSSEPQKTPGATAVPVKASQSPVVINEFLAGRAKSAGESGNDGGDWIELFNGSDREADLTGMCLSDTGENLRKWPLPAGTKIPGKGRLLVWADEDETAISGLHCNFKLSKKGEEISLSVQNDGADVVVDHVRFDKQTDDVSYGRFPDGAETWRPLVPSPGKENRDSE